MMKMLTPDSTALMIKKLRYYARYVVVALVLDKIELVKKLLEELTFDVEEYSRVFKVTPADTAEWQTVLTEVSTFLMVNCVGRLFLIERPRENLHHFHLPA